MPLGRFHCWVRRVPLRQPSRLLECFAGRVGSSLATLVRSPQGTTRGTGAYSCLPVPNDLVTDLMEMRGTRPPK